MLLLASRSAARRHMLEAAGVPFEPAASDIDEEAVKAGLRARGLGAAALAAALAEAKALHPDFEIVIEPGRFLVAEAGALLARASQVVEKDGIRRVGVDAGMHTLLRQAGHDAPIYLHGAMEKITHYYQASGIPLGELRPVKGVKKAELAARQPKAAAA